MEKLYFERCHGRYEAWCYSDGKRHYMKYSDDRYEILAFAERHGYKPIAVV